MASTTKKVGYKSPPQQHQWKKGQSGNPSGKKKGAAVRPKPLLDCFVDKLNEPVETVANGKPMTMSFGAAFVTKTLHDAMNAPLKGKLEAIKALQGLGVLRMQGSMLEANTDEEEVVFSEEHRRMIAIVSREVLGDEPG